MEGIFMKIEIENLTETLSSEDEIYLIKDIVTSYDKFETSRTLQLNDIQIMKNAIYNTDIPKINAWDNNIQLPDIYELAQTLKSHISANLYSHPEAMFDVSGTTPKTQEVANIQKAMLVTLFECGKIDMQQYEYAVELLENNFLKQ